MTRVELGPERRSLGADVASEPKRQSLPGIGLQSSACALFGPEHVDRGLSVIHCHSEEPTDLGRSFSTYSKIPRI